MLGKNNSVNRYVIHFLLLIRLAIHIIASNRPPPFQKSLINTKTYEGSYSKLSIFKYILITCMLYLYPLCVLGVK